jgi:hypothetical protein
MNANDTQVSGNHYKSAIQHWDFVVERKLDYFRAQVTKYVTRWRKKNGLQDLLKAQHFLQKCMELNVAGLLQFEYSPSLKTSYTVEEYCEANDLNCQEHSIISLLCRECTSVGDLRDCQKLLAELVECNQSGEPGPGYVEQG